MRTIYFVRVLDRRKLIRNTNRNLFQTIKSQNTKMLLTVLTNINTKGIFSNRVLKGFL